MNICPKFIHIRAAASGGNPDTFPLIDDFKTARISAIRANTPFPVSVCILSCQNIKMEKSNYCDMENIHNSQADKRVCESNQTNYVFFYVDKSKKGEKSPVYLLAFIRDGELARKAEVITEEFKKTVDWLDSAHNIIHCYIFCYAATPRATVRNDAVIQKQLKKSGDFIYTIRNVPFRLPRVLYVNGGSPRFEIIIQEA